jgi:hypothetical protein
MQIILIENKFVYILFKRLGRGIWMIWNSNSVEKALWSVAIPGFGQLLNRKYFKGLVLIILEFLINTYSHLNMVIILSFYGEMEKAIQHTNYNWLMYYPCVYSFSIWDAFKDGQKVESPLLFIPFVLSAYTGTVGVIYSTSFRINGVLIGPIFYLHFCTFGILFRISAQVYFT